jgi:hypothetical protein
METSGKRDYFHAADILRLELAKDIFRRIVDPQNRFLPDEIPYDPDSLPEVTKNVRMLRRLRDDYGTLNPEVEEFITSKPQFVEVAVMPTKAERFGVLAAIVMAMLCAPFAIALAAYALSNPTFTGFADKLFPIALAEYILYTATQVEVVGYMAAACMLLTFMMTNRLMLRLFALIGNIFFISYGIGAGLVPVVILHAILAPINIGHLWRAIKSYNTRPYSKADLVRSVVKPS